MSTPAKKTAKKTEETPTEFTEVIEIDGRKLIENVEKMVNKQSISRLIIYKANGETFLDISLAAGLTMTILTTFLLPHLLGLVLIGGLLGSFRVEVVHRKTESATPVAEGAQNKQSKEREKVLNE